MQTYLDPFTLRMTFHGLDDCIIFLMLNTLQCSDFHIFFSDPSKIKFLRFNVSPSQHFAQF